MQISSWQGVSRGGRHLLLPRDGHGHNQGEQVCVKRRDKIRRERTRAGEGNLEDTAARTGLREYGGARGEGVRTDGSLFFTVPGQDMCQDGRDFGLP